MPEVAKDPEATQTLLPHKTTHWLWLRRIHAEPPPLASLLSQVNNQSSNVEFHVQQIMILLSPLVNVQDPRPLLGDELFVH